MASAKDEQRSGETTPVAGGEDHPQRLSGSRSHGYSVGEELPLPGRPLRPFVDMVARVGVNIHLKLLAGFLVVVLLLVGMGILSLVVISRMNQRVEELTDLQETVDRSRQAIYLVTAQSHYRAMALVTGDDTWNDKITNAKAGVIENLAEVARLTPRDQGVLLVRISEANQRFDMTGEKVQNAYDAGNTEEALNLHIAEEHEISHEVENALNQQIRDSVVRMNEARAAFQSDRNVLTAVVVTVSGVTLLSALSLGFVLSWAFIRPVRRIDYVLRAIALGDFTQRVEVPNRDEFGTLSTNVNHVSQQLGSLYEELQSLNEDLQQRVGKQVRELEREVRGRERIEQELRVAHDIQLAFLPKELPHPRGWQVEAYYEPARAVGGDFYDFIDLPDGRLGMVVGDVSDKGVPAALVMCATRSMLRAAAQRLNSPGAVLEQVNELLHGDIPPSMFVTCLYAVLDLASGRMRFANAGHNLPYLRSEGSVAELRATGMPLGLMPGMTYEEKTVTLAPGDGVLFHSDGLVEAHNADREMFGFPRLKALVERHPGGAQLIDLLVAELARFAGPHWEQEDDVTFVTLQRATATAATPAGEVQP